LKLAKEQAAILLKLQGTSSELVKDKEKKKKG
jgi:hypothetical protein